MMGIKGQHTVLWGIIALGLVGGAAMGDAQDRAGHISAEAEALIADLDVADGYVRQRAFMRLEALREPATAGIIRERLHDRRATTRAFSVRALAAVEGTKALPELLERLAKDRDRHVRVAAILAMEPFQQEHPEILDAYIRALRDRKREVRMAAIDAVSRIDHPHAREAIQVRWHRERDRDVRRVLEDAMRRLAETPSAS